MKNFFREPFREVSYHLGNNLNFPPHIHDDIELVFMKRGNTNITLNGQNHTIAANDILIVFPNQVHCYTECTVPCEALVLIINPNLLLKGNDIFKGTLPYTPIFQNEQAVFLMEAALKEFNATGTSDLFLSLITAAFLTLIKTDTLTNPVKDSDTASKILKYCGDHFKENISISKISKELNLSRSHISHTFSERLKVSFCEYVNSLRLIESTKLLRNKELSITEVAGLSGFQTIRSFNRAFLKHYKTSPTSYRKKIRLKTSG